MPNYTRADGQEPGAEEFRSELIRVDLDDDDRQTAIQQVKNELGGIAFAQDGSYYLAEENGQWGPALIHYSYEGMSLQQISIKTQPNGVVVVPDPSLPIVTFPKHMERRHTIQLLVCGACVLAVIAGVVVLVRQRRRRPETNVRGDA